MDGQYNINNDIKTSYSTYQQPQRQEMSVGEAIKILSEEILRYVTKVGIDINPKYGHVKTGDGRFGIVRTDPDGIAFYTKIPDPIAKVISDMIRKYIPININNLDKLVKDTNITVVVGNRPDIYITNRQTNNHSQK